MRTRWLATLPAVVVACASAGCTTQAVPSKETMARSNTAIASDAVLLTGAGATFPSILYEEWFRRYHAEHPKTAVAYDAVGSGEGVRRFIAVDVKDEERVDFGASDAAMTDEELARVPAGAALVPVTAGSVAIAYNLPDVSDDLRLSRQAYVGIFLGQIKTWNDPAIAKANPGVKLPNLTIATVVRQESSGTTFAFTKHLDAISDLWRARYGPATAVNWPGNAMRAVGNEGVAGRIKQSTGSIGYVGYEFARRTGLTIARLENGAGKFVTPTAATSSAALEGVDLPENMRFYVSDPASEQAYPIVTLTWILLYRHYADSQKAAEIRRVFRWCLTDGQQQAAALGYVPLPSSIVSRSIALLDRLQSGG